jgi:D-alanyl-D-alanine carboxypeptidase
VIIVDRQSKAVIYMKNPDEKLYPASITKMVTGLVAAENYLMDDIVTLKSLTNWTGNSSL